MVARLESQPDLSLALETAVRDIVALHGAEFGNVQILGEDGHLWIVGHQGLSGSFVDAVARIPTSAGTACARAWREGRIVHVPNVHKDEAFKPHLDLAEKAGFMAVISAPLISSRLERIGVISAHFARARSPSAIEVSTLSSYCRKLADNLLERARASELSAKVRELQASMLQRSRAAA